MNQANARRKECRRELEQTIEALSDSRARLETSRTVGVVPAYQVERQRQLTERFDRLTRELVAAEDAALPTLEQMILKSLASEARRLHDMVEIALEKLGGKCAVAGFPLRISGSIKIEIDPCSDRESLRAVLRALDEHQGEEEG